MKLLGQSLSPPCTPLPTILSSIFTPLLQKRGDWGLWLGDQDSHKSIQGEL